MTRAHVVELARGWLGTRWVHQGRLRGVGVDCVGLVIGVAREAQLASAEVLADLERELGGYDTRPDGRLLAIARARLCEIPLAAIAPGDVLAMRFEREPQHLALVGEHAGALTLIHAAARLRRVVEHQFDELSRLRTVAAFCFPALRGGNV